MTPEEKKVVRAGKNQFEIKKIMDDCRSNVRRLLAGNERATVLSGKILWGNYLVNTAEEIANYCIKEATV